MILLSALLENFPRGSSDQNSDMLDLGDARMHSGIRNLGWDWRANSAGVASNEQAVAVFNERWSG